MYYFLLGTIYSADDKLRNEKVALKIEKPDKSKRILMFEYDVLKQLSGLQNVCQAYEFVERTNGAQNFIVMKLLGKNLATLKKSLGRKFTLDFAINLLLQMLDAIEAVHSKGFIHRDIKPSNFVMGKGSQKKKVFIVDFGLAKLHLQNGEPVAMRKSADFRGTITYASLNAHQKIDLARRDDLWSFYFVILDFFNEVIPWRNSKHNQINIQVVDNVKDEVKDLKMKCLKNPEKYLWTTTTKRFTQIRDIFYHIKGLEYSEKPQYSFIAGKLKEILAIHNQAMYPQPMMYQLYYQNYYPEQQAYRNWMEPPSINQNNGPQTNYYPDYDMKIMKNQRVPDPLMFANNNLAEFVNQQKNQQNENSSVEHRIGDIESSTGIQYMQQGIIDSPYQKYNSPVFPYTNVGTQTMFQNYIGQFPANKQLSGQPVYNNLNPMGNPTSGFFPPYIPEIFNPEGEECPALTPHYKYYEPPNYAIFQYPQQHGKKQHHQPSQFAPPISQQMIVPAPQNNQFQSPVDQQARYVPPIQAGNIPIHGSTSSGSATNIKNTFKPFQQHLPQAQQQQPLIPQNPQMKSTDKHKDTVKLYQQHYPKNQQEEQKTPNEINQGQYQHGNIKKVHILNKREMKAQDKIGKHQQKLKQNYEAPQYQNPQLGYQSNEEQPIQIPKNQQGVYMFTSNVININQLNSQPPVGILMQPDNKIVIPMDQNQDNHEIKKFLKRHLSQGKRIAQQHSIYKPIFRVDFDYEQYNKIYGCRNQLQYQ